MSVEKVVEGHRGFPSLKALFGIALASTAMSSGLHLLVAPTIAPHLANVARSSHEVAPWVLPRLQVFEVLAYALSGYTSTKDVILLSVLSRTVFMTILHVSYQVPLFVLLMTLSIDVISLWAPIQLFINPRTQRRVSRLEIKKEWSLSVVLTMIASSVISIALYVVQKTRMPAFMLGHFDGIQNIQTTPLPLLLLAFLPAGYCLQEFVYTHGFHDGTIAILISSFLVTFTKVALGIKGGDLLGIFGATNFGNAIAATAALVIGFILRI